MDMRKLAKGQSLWHLGSLLSEPIEYEVEKITPCRSECNLVNLVLKNKHAEYSCFWELTGLGDKPQELLLFREKEEAYRKWHDGIMTNLETCKEKIMIAEKFLQSRDNPV